jgi:hypothetical protein
MNLLSMYVAVHTQILYSMIQGLVMLSVMWIPLFTLLVLPCMLLNVALPR